MPGQHATGTLGILSSSELDRDIAGVQGTYGWNTMSGAVTFNTGVTFNVAAIAIGDCVVNGVTNTAAYVAATVVLTAQDPTNPRVDIIVVTSGGAVSAVAGTPKALTTTSGPVPTAPSATQLEIARIFVPASGTLLSAANITDRRVPLPVANTRNNIRDQLIAGRRLVAQFLGGGLPPDQDYPNGFSITGNTASVQTDSGEPYTRFGGGIGASSIHSASSVGALAQLRPSKSPRMLVKVIPPAASANNSYWMAGFFVGLNSATDNGAGIRAVTTGNLFFVTRQGGAESTTSLGASPTVLTSYIIETADAGVTWRCWSISGGVATLQATNTTNVPTAATGLQFGVSQLSATGAVVYGVGFVEVDASF